MGKTAIGVREAELLVRLAALYQYTADHGDLETAEKVRQLAKKTFQQEYTIAFCGHFSAGKSTMINHLVGKDVLPTSPIPTSANLVKITKGQDSAKVFFNESEPLLYPAPYDFNLIKDYCKDGDLISLIEVKNMGVKIPGNMALLDTPGIDSTDDAHRLATESALHLADLVFYCMDYNHVQSEVNFLFTKELVDAGKDVYLVINQIDKHRSAELTFDAFGQSVENAFASWGVVPKDIFYTTMKVPDHEQNEWKRLQRFMDEVYAKKEILFPISITRSLQKLSRLHLEGVQKRHKHLIDEWSERVEDQGKDYSFCIEQLEQDMAEALEHSTKVLVDLKKELNDIITNAYLMPFQTREKAERFLESSQKDFKLGWWLNKKKTDHEKQVREDSLLKDLDERIKTQLEWHIIVSLQKVMKENNLTSLELSQEIQHFSLTITADLLYQAVKKDARLSPEYVLNFTNDMVQLIARHTRNKLDPIISNIGTLLNSNLITAQQQQQKELASLKQAYEAQQQVKLILETEEQIEQDLIKIQTSSLDRARFGEIIDTMVKEEPYQIVSKPEPSFDRVVSVEPFEPKTKDIRMDTNLQSHTMEDTVTKLRALAEKLDGVPSFATVRSELFSKAERLEGKGFTIALFGAFSAGKSSFANALLGANVLPVSPNPTTAAINKILPVDSLHPHGLVLIKLKAKTQLLEEVNRSLRVFDLSAQTLPEAVKLSNTMDVTSSSFDVQEKVHYSFLTAFAQGYVQLEGLLGTTMTSQMEEFPDYVANEQKSCFVEFIELYYDCHLTRQGITLVDTPGADSINARHTGVAFDYIKNADVLLFVTYYNHAFSKADREFLIQLGRVKDSFSLDKMFFLVNAIDLANTKEELDTVLHYVTDQLVKYGIRSPHIYPVSSMLAIQEKLEQVKKSSLIERFEDDFYSFIHHDLTELAVKSAKAEMKRVHHLVQTFIESASEDQSEKERRLCLLKAEREKQIQSFQQKDRELYETRLQQESAELAFYIKQRVFYRLPDFFKEAFHPALIKDDGRNLKKALRLALDEFLASIGFDLTQELQATALRVEKFLSTLLLEKEQKVVEEVQRLNKSIAIAPFEDVAYPEIHFELAFADLERILFKKALSLFKNPKSFFENNEKKIMMEEIENALQVPADEYVHLQMERLSAHYKGIMTERMTNLLFHIQSEVEQYYDVMETALTDQVDAEELHAIDHFLSDLIIG